MPHVRRVLLLATTLAGLAGCEQTRGAHNDINGADLPTNGAHTITGAGATFPYPALERWASAHHDAAGVALSYAQLGSEGGLTAIRNREVDFGATDVPLSPEELAREGLVQFPLVIGGVAPVVHLPGVAPGQLNLTGELLAGIYLGEITRWNDPALVAINPDLPFPEREITPIHRADSSGTNWLVTHYLSGVSVPWRQSVGTGTKVSWSTGVGAKTSGEVARFVGRFKYTIGYVELSYANQMQLAWARLRNRSGSYVPPSAATFGAAVENATWEGAPAMRVRATDRAGPGVWPITGASYILIAKKQKNLRRARMVLEFFHRALTEDAGLARELDYVTLPAEQVADIETLWREAITAEAAPVWL